MARLLGWPRGLAIIARQRLAGPRSVGSSSSESTQGFVQTVSSVFGAWRYQFSLRPMRGNLARRHRGTVTALHGGANAIRVPWCDPDIMSWRDSGVNATSAQINAGCAWSNGQSWSNGQNWRASRPWGVLASDAALGDDIVSLADDAWGHDLQIGDQIGFVPFHFGKYEVTEVIEAGEYRIWPPLRKELAAGSYATLAPTMVMRLEGEQAGTINRNSRLAEGNTVNMVEVQDPDVRDFFAD